MVHPWNKNSGRHRSWASDTIVSAVLFVILLITTVVVDQLNGPAEPPAYLTGLLAASGLALFGAAGSDKAKSNRETSDKADRADRRTTDTNITAVRGEAKVDEIIELLREARPDLADRLPSRLLDPEPDVEPPAQVTDKPPGGDA